MIKTFSSYRFWSRDAVTLSRPSRQVNGMQPSRPHLRNLARALRHGFIPSSAALCGPVQSWQIRPRILSQQKGSEISQSRWSLPNVRSRCRVPGYLHPPPLPALSPHAPPPPLPRPARQQVETSLTKELLPSLLRTASGAALLIRSFIPGRTL